MCTVTQTAFGLGFLGIVGAPPSRRAFLQEISPLVRSALSEAQLIKNAAVVVTIGLLNTVPVASSDWGSGDGHRSVTAASKSDSVSAVDDIQAALEEEDEVGRLFAVEKSVRNGLLNPTVLVRLEVESFLGHLTDRDDFRGLGQIAVECRKLYGSSEEEPHCAEWFFDDIKLANLDIVGRTDYYHQAIVNGAVDLWFGSTLWRSSAMIKAVNDGISELEPLILEFYPMLNDSQQEMLPKEEIRPTLELRRGAADRDEACLIAAERLKRRNSQEVLLTLESDSGFRAAVFGLANESCSGACSRTACHLLRATATRLQHAARELSERQESTVSAEKRQSMEDMAGRLLTYTDPE